MKQMKPLQKNKSAEPVNYITDVLGKIKRKQKEEGIKQKKEDEQQEDELYKII